MWIRFQVERDDETTKLCENCVVKIADILHFREICATTNAVIKKSKQLHKGFFETSAAAIKAPNVSVNAENSNDQIVLRNRCASSAPSGKFVPFVYDADSEMDEADADPETTSRRPISSAEKTSLHAVWNAGSSNRKQTGMDSSYFEM